jgi:hypothetical protein
MKSGFMRALKFDLWMLGTAFSRALLVAVIMALMLSRMNSNTSSLYILFFYPLMLVALACALIGAQRYSALRYTVGYSICRKNLFCASFTVNVLTAITIGTIAFVMEKGFNFTLGTNITMNYFVFVAGICFMCSFGDFLGLLMGTKTKVGSVLYFILFFVILIPACSAASLMVSPVMVLQQFVDMILHSYITALVCLGLFAVTTMINWRILMRNEVYG